MGGEGLVSFWWKFPLILFFETLLKWSYSQAAIDSRNQTCTNYPDKCQDEQWFIRDRVVHSHWSRFVQILCPHWFVL